MLGLLATSPRDQRGLMIKWWIEVRMDGDGGGRVSVIGRVREREGGRQRRRGFRFARFSKSGSPARTVSRCESVVSE